MAFSPRSEIIVVGSGVIGAWTAWSLLQAGVKVTLLDAWGSGNTRSSSGGESRVLRCVYGPDERYARMTRSSLTRWKSMQERFGLTFFKEMGALWLVSEGDERYLTQAESYLEKMNWPLHELDPAELPDRYPSLSADGVQRAWLEPQAGLLHARQAQASLWNILIREGVDCRTVAARPGDIRGDTLQNLHLSDGTRIAADAFVFCCGPWLRRIFPTLLRDHTRITRQEVYFFSLPAGDAKHRFPALPVWLEFGTELYYGLPLDNLRGFKVADDDRDHDFDPDSGDRVPSPWRVEKARAFLSRRFPGLAGASLQECRVCQYLNSTDGHFIIDRHPDLENLWLAGAGSGHAFKMGPALGEYLSGQLLGTGAKDPSFGLDRLSRLDDASFNQFVVK